MKEPYPLCRKHGVAIDHERGYVSWQAWKEWKAVPGNQALMDKLPAYATICTIDEWGVPACDVEVWLAMATNARPVHPEEID